MKGKVLPMKTRKFLSGVLAAAMLLSFAGCGNTGDTTETTTAADGGDTTTVADGGDTTTAADGGDSNETGIPEGLTLKVLTNRTDRDEDGSLDAMTDAFEEKYKCTVEYQSYTDYADDVITMMSTTEYGDVLMIPDAVKLAELSNFFEPLGTQEELSKKYNWTDKKAYDGVVYGLAHLGTVQGGICYNKRIWAEAGVTELPKTPEAFIEALEMIRDNTDAIPYYTNFSSAWCIAQWPGLVLSASGNPNFENEIMIEGKPLIEEGNAYYNVYKLLFDIYSDPTLIEEDPMSADWEGSKPAINNGEIATMVQGSWAVSQFQAAGDHPEDIGYMPAPFSIDGKQFAETSADYCLAVNKNSDDDTKALAKAYVFWFIDESGFAQAEGGLSTLKGGEMPEYLEAFADCELFEKAAEPEGLKGTWNTIDVDSEVGTWKDDTANFKIQIAEAALKGQDFSAVEEIFAATNAKWAATRDANEALSAYLAG